MQATKQSNSTSDSVASDQEVEDLTSRVSKLEPSQEDDYDTMVDNEMAGLADLQQTQSTICSTPTSPKAKSAPTTPCNITSPGIDDLFTKGDVYLKDKDYTSTIRILNECLVDAAGKSKFKTNFERKYMQLKEHKLENQPFVVVSVLGQELLMEGHSKHAAVILESALKMGCDNKEFRASVLSTVSYAYYVMKNYEKAVAYMQQELEIECEVVNQCKVLSNLGYTYYKMRNFDKSIEMHREQVKVAMTNHLYQQAAAALNAMGHVHMARNDLESALFSHTNCLNLLRSLEDEFSQYKEILAIGHIHAMKAEHDKAEDKYNEAIQLLQTSKTITRTDRTVGYIMVKFNRAYIYLRRRQFKQACDLYKHVIELAHDLPEPKNSIFKTRGINGLVHTQRLFKEISEAQQRFKQQQVDRHHSLNLS